MTRNLGDGERVVRTAGAAVALLLAYLIGSPYVALGLLVVSIYLGVTALMRFCPLRAAFRRPSGPPPPPGPEPTGDGSPPPPDDSVGPPAGSVPPPGGSVPPPAS